MEIQKQYTNCVWCKKSLTPIGHSRLFGANHKDWIGRNTHKKCWIENELKQQKKKPEGIEYKNVMVIELK